MQIKISKLRIPKLTSALKASKIYTTPATFHKENPNKSSFRQQMQSFLQQTSPNAKHIIAGIISGADSNEN